VFHVDDVEPIANRPRRALRILFAHELLDATWSVFDGGERGAEPHFHRRHVDAFYVVDGELTFRIGPSLTPVQAGPGTFVQVPPGVVHAFDNESDSVARWLNFHGPSTGFAAYLRGERDRFDSFDPPEDGGLDPALVVIATADSAEKLGSDEHRLTLLGIDPLLSVVRIDAAPGVGAESFSLSAEVDAFFVLAGDGELTLGDRSLTGGPGTWMAAAPGETHALVAAGDERASILNIRAPDAGFADTLRR
jgi:quercetin dioxygenase-like cupin family protein